MHETDRFMSAAADRLLELLVATGVRVRMRTLRAAVRRPLVVTRHRGLVDYLLEVGLIGPDAQLIPHVDHPEALVDQLVIGVVPLQLAAWAIAVVEVPLAMTAADRAAGDLPLARVREIAGPPEAYSVRRLGAISTAPRDG